MCGNLAMIGDDNKGISIMSRHRYPVEISRVFEHTTREKLETAFEYVAHEKKYEHLNNCENGNDSSNASTGPSGTNKNDNTHAKQTTLKVVLGEALVYGPALSEHIILATGLTPSTKLHKEFKMKDNSIQVLTEAVMKFEDWLSEAGEKVPKGYILMQHKILEKNDDAIFNEFCPLLLNQFKSRDSNDFETFDAALDEFYSKIESQRVEQQQKAKENSAVQKLDRIKSDQICAAAWRAGHTC